MEHPRSIANLLNIALGEAPEPTLSTEEARSLQMIRTIIETIHGDVQDPLPNSLLKSASGLAQSLPVAPSWFDRAVAKVLAPLFDDRPQLALGLRGDDLRQCTFSCGDLRLDLEVEALTTPATNTDEDSSRIRGQIDSEHPLIAPIPVAVFLADTDRLVTSTTTQEDGRFDIELPPGEFEFAFRLDNDTQIIGRIEIP